MSCPVTIQPIYGNECIGDSLPKIVGNFEELKDAACDLYTKVESLSSTKANNLSVVDSPTIDLSYNSSTGVLSADVSTITPFFTGTSNQLLSSSGYQKLPGGLIIQWGIVTVNYNQSINGPFAFPFSFNQTPYTIVATISSNNFVSGTNAPYITQITPSNFKIVGEYTYELFIKPTYWIAIGS